MKFLLPLLSIVVGLVALVASAADVSLMWDAPGVFATPTDYRLYEQKGSNWSWVKTVTDTQTTVEAISPGVHTYAVTATNANGESIRSNEASTTNAYMIVRVFLEAGPGTAGPWVESGFLIVTQALESAAGFYRARVITEMP